MPGATKTPWWFCSACGFKNHPRPNQDSGKCEQCGHVRDGQDVDYVPKET